MTLLFTHPDCLLHENNPGHPESPDRLRSILRELEKPAYRDLQKTEAPLATIEQIARVHDSDYIASILSRVPPQGFISLDSDTGMAPGSDQSALRAAGAAIGAVDAVMSGKSKNAFCAIRPPGHHAEEATVMGFCLFNNIAVGAAHARSVYKTRRIAILDFDVHHGNGTQDFAQKQDDVLFISSHQFPLWPGTGFADDKGPKGNIINLPLPIGSDGSLFREAMLQRALPAIDAFQPDLLMISAGFDAHKDDPLAQLNWVEDDYRWITLELKKRASQHCQGRLVSFLEGGYNLEALAASAAVHVAALMNDG